MLIIIGPCSCLDTDQQVHSFAKEYKYQHRPTYSSRLYVLYQVAPTRWAHNQTCVMGTLSSQLSAVADITY